MDRSVDDPDEIIVGEVAKALVLAVIGLDGEKSGTLSLEGKDLFLPLPPTLVRGKSRAEGQKGNPHRSEL